MILSVACWRYHFLRKWIYYFELVALLLYSLLPLDVGNAEQIISLFYNCFIFVAFSSNLGVDIVAAIVIQFLVQFVTLPINEIGSLASTKVVYGLLNVLVVFTICTLLHALITYTATIEARLSELIVENLGLLDGMHEGIIVISGKDESI